MKILFLATDIYDSIGGIQVYTAYLISTLIDLGNTLCVISINDTKNDTNYPRFSTNYFFHTCGEYGHMRKYVFAMTLFKQVICFKPDLIICGHVSFSGLCLVAKIIFNLPYVIITYGIEAWKLNKLKMLGMIHSKKIISVSGFTKNKILKQIPDYNENDIFVLHGTFDVQRFRPFPKPRYLMDKLNLSEDDKLILTIARLSATEKYKGYDKVIIAMREIIKKIEKVKYILVGCGDDEKRVRALVKDYGLQSRVILARFVPRSNTVDYYNLCDLFIMPSTQEGFGIVFLEALACGKPVIAGNQDGSREALLDGKLGFLVDPDDINQIAQAIIKILKREADSHLLDTRFLRQSAIENFGIKRFRQKVSALLSCIGG